VSLKKETLEMNSNGDPLSTLDHDLGPQIRFAEALRCRGDPRGEIADLLHFRLQGDPMQEIARLIAAVR